MKTFILFLFLCVMCFDSQASELFIRVNANGNFNTSVMGQTQVSNTNTFRFFDLPSGNIPVVIDATYPMTGNLFNNHIFLQTNERLVVEINHLGALIIIVRMNIKVMSWYLTIAQNYGEDDWVTMPGNGGYHDNSYKNSNFNKFIDILKKESFDNTRMAMAKDYISRQYLRSDQIKQIMKTMTFDSNRLELAKYAYEYCLDPQNYVLLRDVFSFSTNFDNLMKSIRN